MASQDKQNNPKSNPNSPQQQSQKSAVERPFTRTQGDVPPEDLQVKAKERKPRPKPTGDVTTSTSLDQSAGPDLAPNPPSQARHDTLTALPVQQSVDSTSGPPPPINNTNVQSVPLTEVPGNSNPIDSSGHLQPSQLISLAQQRVAPPVPV